MLKKSILELKGEMSQQNHTLSHYSFSVFICIW